MKYRIHRVHLNMKKDQNKLEQFLNDLEGEIVSIIPNISMHFGWAHRVDFLLVVEKVGK